MIGQSSLFVGHDPHAGATFSVCAKYRFALSRVWGDPTDRVAFVLLNPSTATAFVDDPTIRRCVGYAKLWGAAGALDVVNLFALRSTDPKALYGHPSPVQPLDGSENDEAILNVAKHARIVVAGWGKHGALHHRDGFVAALLGVAKVELFCLATNADGSPSHPLYLPKDARRVRWAVPQ